MLLHTPILGKPMVIIGSLLPEFTETATRLDTLLVKIKSLIISRHPECAEVVPAYRGVSYPGRKVLFDNTLNLVIQYKGAPEMKLLSMQLHRC